MPRTARRLERAGRLGVAASLLALGASCGGVAGPGGPAGASLPAPGSCTGVVPAHAAMCPGADSDLTSDVPRALLASCACAAPCAPRACAYVCDPGYALDGGSCVAAPAPPAPVLRDDGDGTVTVTDRFGTLAWLRDADCAETVGGVPRSAGVVSWADAVAWSAGLATGACGLRDGSTPGAWRLPTPDELMHLALVLGPGTPFANVQAATYWSSFAHHAPTHIAAVDLTDGQSFDYPEDSLFHVWPVRSAGP